MKRVGGGEVEVDFNTLKFKSQYFDECTGEPLPNHLVRAAMIEETSYFSEKAVWTAADWAHMKSSKDATFVRMRWVLCNKGDLKEPDVRARLVACEVAKDKVPAFYASTPPLESNKALFSRYSAQRTQDGLPLALSFIDIKKADFKEGTPARYLHGPTEGARSGKDDQSTNQVCVRDPRRKHDMGGDLSAMPGGSRIYLRAREPMLLLSSGMEAVFGCAR